MAAQLFKRSVWYWDKRSDELEDKGGGEEQGKLAALTEKEQPEVHISSRTRSGVVVLLGWMLSERKHLSSFTRLYKSLGWDCLASHPHFLNLFFPSMAASLALSILLELGKDLETHPCPVVFVTFSGGHKACLYKIIQILLGQCREVSDDKLQGRFNIVAESVSGLIFDSSPMEFESNIGAKFVSQQMLTLKPGKSSALILRGAHALGRGLDTVFFKQLDLQRVDLWHALYSFVNVGPILIVSSEIDELAPLETIHIFSSNVCKLGGQVNVVMWNDSKHVGHLRRHPEEYSNEVRKLLLNASSTYFDRLKWANNYSRGLRDSSSAWRNLPESTLSEIKRMSKGPHMQLKGGIQPNTIERANSASMAGQINGCRSRL